MSISAQREGRAGVSELLRTIFGDTKAAKAISNAPYRQLELDTQLVHKALIDALFPVMPEWVTDGMSVRVCRLSVLGLLQFLFQLQ